MSDSACPPARSPRLARDRRLIGHQRAVYIERDRLSTRLRSIANGGTCEYETPFFSAPPLAGSPFEIDVDEPQRENDVPELDFVEELPNSRQPSCEGPVDSDFDIPM